MRRLSSAIVIVLLFFTGCSGNRSVLDFVMEGGLETKGLVNLALASNGGRVVASKDNTEHPASTLINGITSSENWNQGEGWEAKHEGRFARGGYTGYGVEDPYMAEERGFGETFDPGDSSWRGLRVQMRNGSSVDSALGWVIVELPEEKAVNRAIVHTIDSAEYPAAKFGVRDLMVQYWSKAVDSWAVVDRVGKAKGQSGNTIQDNESGVITLRFQPVRTTRLRFVIRWTNDSKERRRGYYMHSNGTIRLLEIEVYGYEEEKTDSEVVVPAVNVIQDTGEVAAVRAVINNYADGYNKRNVDILMASVSEDYLKGEETYSDLWERMKSILMQYEEVRLRLENVKVSLTGEGATATSRYAARYKKTAHEPLIASGF